MAQQNDSTPSPLLPSDPFDQQFARLMGLPNGAAVDPVAVATVDYYGKATNWIVQTIRGGEGDTVFLTCSDATRYLRVVIPSRVLATIDRQRDTIVSKVRRNHGKRLAERRPPTVFTPEMRAKALETRRRKAAERKARRARKAAR